VSPAGLEGVRVLVLGLGRFGGGLGVSRWLLDQGALVTVTDRASREQLDGPASAVEEAGARLLLGGHEGVDLACTDLLVVNPAVPLEAPLVTAARERGVRLTSEIGLLMERWPGPLLGVTGSNGKSTTVGLAGAVLGAAGVSVETGGNLGGSLLSRLGQVARGTVAVLELSSFMLEMLALRQRKAAAGGGEALGPEVAVITNFTPNHLDRHGNMQAYGKAKAAILAQARAAVLPHGDAAVEALAAGFQGSVLHFGDARAAQSGNPAPKVHGSVPDLGVDGLGNLVGASGSVVLSDTQIPLPGRMNRLDLAAATLAVGALLSDPQRALDALPAALERFRLPPHRLQLVALSRGVRWVDDSVSTTPESTAASLEAVTGGCLLIVGGRDKGLDPEPLLMAAVGRVRRAFTVGEQAAPLANALNRSGVNAEQVNTVEAAVTRASQIAREGETVLLSPGFSSHDQFAHFEQRAQAFVEAVAALEGPVPLS
jgi:UDP-N-acetylmuramoylalanine--D-glutamate ligase